MERTALSLRPAPFSLPVAGRLPGVLLVIACALALPNLNPTHTADSSSPRLSGTGTGTGKPVRTRFSSEPSGLIGHPGSATQAREAQEPDRRVDA